jgi:hypothetical protein
MTPITVIICEDGRRAKEKNPHEKSDNMPREGAVNEMESLLYDQWEEAEKNLRTFEIESVSVNSHLGETVFISVDRFELAPGSIHQAELAIEFAEWISENAHLDAGGKYYISSGGPFDILIATSELFKLFLETKTV